MLIFLSLDVYKHLYVYIFSNLFSVDPSRASISSLLSNDFWGTPIHLASSHKSYRPLTIYTFRLNFWLNISSPFRGETVRYSLPNTTPDEIYLHPFGFHLVNCILHTLNSLLVYTLYFSHASAKGSRYVGALLAAMLFATHPVHVEAVAGIVGRAELLAVFSMMITVLMYNRCAAHLGETTWKGALSCLLLTTCIVCATISKEIGLTLVGILMFHDFFYISRFYRCLQGSFSSYRQLLQDTSLHQKSLYLFLNRMAVLPVIGLSFLLARRYLTVNLVLDNFRFVENPIPFLSTPLARLLSTAQVHAQYFSLLLYPARLCHDWSFEAVPVVEELNDWSNWKPLLLYFTIIFIGMKYTSQLFTRHTGEVCQCVIMEVRKWRRKGDETTRISKEERLHGLTGHRDFSNLYSVGRQSGGEGSGRWGGSGSEGEDDGERMRAWETMQRKKKNDLKEKKGKLDWDPDHVGRRSWGGSGHSATGSDSWKWKEHLTKTRRKREQGDEQQQSVADPAARSSLEGRVSVEKGGSGTDSERERREGISRPRSTQNKMPIPRKKFDVMVLYSLAWLLLPFLPASHLFFYPGTTVAERLLYAPSVGFCLLSATLFVHVVSFLVREAGIIMTYFRTNSRSNPSRLHSTPSKSIVSPAKLKLFTVFTRLSIKLFALLLAVSVLIVFAHMTRANNLAWATEETLYLRSLQNCPQSAKVQSSVGHMYRRQQNHSLAERHYERALDIITPTGTLVIPFQTQRIQSIDR